jgi:hypothetical protein
MGQNRPATLGHAVYFGLPYCKPFADSRLGNHGGHGKYPLSANTG